MKIHRITRITSTFIEHFIFFSFDLMSKADDDWRRIHDLFYFKFKENRVVVSVNAYIPEEWSILKYVTFDEIVDALIIQDREAMLIKRDLAKAFRHISVIRADWWLLNFFWKEHYYYDRFLLFDFRTSLYIFDFFAKALHWILIIVFHWAVILHYLNDFFAVLFFTTDYKLYEQQFNQLCHELDFKINIKKSICDSIIKFLEIELDSDFMKARLSAKKFERAV